MREGCGEPAYRQRRAAGKWPRTVAFMVRKTQPPPGPLGEHGSRMWTGICRVYDLSPGELETLWQAAQTADLIAALDEILWAGSATTTGAQGQVKLSPLIAALADQRRLLDGLIRSLSLPMPGESEGRRRSPVAQMAAQQRWRQEKEARRG
jgi:hypothetical protein